MRAYTTRCPSTASRCTIRLALLPERAGGDLHRWISPQFISTNELESARSDSGQAAYGELRSLGAKVNQVLGIATPGPDGVHGVSATHMEWFFGHEGSTTPGTPGWSSRS